MNPNDSLEWVIATAAFVCLWHRIIRTMFIYLLTWDAFFIISTIGQIELIGNGDWFSLESMGMGRSNGLNCGFYYSWMDLFNWLHESLESVDCMSWEIRMSIRIIGVNLIARDLKFCKFNGSLVLFQNSWLIFMFKGVTFITFATWRPAISHKKNNNPKRRMTSYLLPLTNLLNKLRNSQTISQKNVEKYSFCCKTCVTTW